MSDICQANCNTIGPDGTAQLGATLVVGLAVVPVAVEERASVGPPACANTVQCKK